MIRIVIVEDSAIVQNYFRNLLEKEEKFQLIACFDDAFKAEETCKSGNVDIVLMDVMTAKNHSGLAAGKRIRESEKGAKVLIVTSLIDPDVIEKAKQGAADSLWYKDHGTDELIQVIYRTVEGEHVFPEEAPNIALGDMFSKDLSPRQMQVLRRFVKGLTYEEIAEELGITTRGVRWHMNEIMEMGGFKNRHEMLSSILQNNFIITTLLDEE